MILKIAHNDVPIACGYSQLESGRRLLLDTVTLLVVGALVVAFSGLLLLLAPGASHDSRTMRVWGLSLLTGAIGLTVSAVGDFYGRSELDVLGTVLFLLASATAWVGARRFAGRTLKGWWPMIPPLAWLACGLILPWAGVRLALACWIGATTTALAAAELWRGRRERLPSMPAVSLVLAIHAIVYLVRGAVALGGGVRPKWDVALRDGMVLESLLHSMGIAFLIVAMMKERSDLRSREHLRTLALSDGLTGIANRRNFDLVFSFEATRIRRMRDRLSLVLFDVDHFKMFNDLLGHPEGDRCLQLLAHAARDAVQHPNALVARYGGEEFAILLPSVSLTGAVRCAEQVRKAVEDLALPFPGIGVVTISAGVAASTGGSLSSSPNTLIADADRALYRAKATGRNRTCTAADPAPAVSVAGAVVTG